MKKSISMFLALILTLALGATAVSALAETAAAPAAEAVVEVTAAELETILGGALAAEQETLALYKAAAALDTTDRRTGRLVIAQEMRVTILKGLLVGNGFAVPADMESAAAPATLPEILAAVKLAEEAKAALYTGYLAKNLPDNVERVINNFQRTSQMRTNMVGNGEGRANGSMGPANGNMGRGMRGMGRNNAGQGNMNNNSNCNCNCNCGGAD